MRHVKINPFWDCFWQSSVDHSNSPQYTFGRPPANASPLQGSPFAAPETTAALTSSFNLNLCKVLVGLYTWKLHGDRSGLYSAAQRASYKAQSLSSANLSFQDHFTLLSSRHIFRCSTCSNLFSGFQLLTSLNWMRGHWLYLDGFCAWNSGYSIKL